MHSRQSSPLTPPQRITLAVILIVGGVLRLGGLSQIEFRYDSAYWAMEALDIVEGARPVLGQQVGSVSVPLYNGPLMSYLASGVFAVVGPRPEAVAAMVALANVIGVWLTFVVSRRLCRNNWCALIAPALMATAPWFVLHGRMLWPQSLFPALMPLVWLALSALLARPGWIRGVVLGLCLGLGLQLHLSMLAVAGLVTILATVASSRRVLTGAAIVLGILLGYAPLVIYDLTHDFETLRTLAALPTLHAATEPRLTHAVKALWNFSNILSGQAMWVSKLGPPSPLPPVIDWGQGVLLTAAFAAASLLALQALLSRDRRTWTARLQSPEALLLLLVWGPVLYLALSSAQITRHYFLVLFPLPYLLTAWAADRMTASGLVSRSALAGLLAALVLNGATLGYFFDWLARTGGAAAYGPVLNDRAEAVSAIRNDSGGRFSVDVSGTREPLPYVFLFEREQPVQVDADPERVATIASSALPAGPATPHYRIVEPEFGRASGGAGTVLWRSPGIVVERITDPAAATATAR